MFGDGLGEPKGEGNCEILGGSTRSDAHLLTDANTMTIRST